MAAHLLRSKKKVSGNAVICLTAYDLPSNYGPAILGIINLSYCDTDLYSKTAL